MQVAFAVHFAKRIVDADGILDMKEIELLTMAFPNPWMSACGFLDNGTNLLPAYESVYRESLRTLPKALTLTQKLDLVTLFHRTCMADGELHQDELEILFEAARKLHISRGAVRKHLANLRCGGTLVPPVRG